MNRWLLCPTCRLPFERSDRTYRCENGHSHDLAREGYLNLLLAQARRSHDPGYSKEMIASRHRFFTGGHYAPLADGVAAIIDEYLQQRRASTVPITEPPRVLDAGCGEGYYLRRLRAHFDVLGESIDLCGIDISKHGIKIAAKRDPKTVYAVASTHDLPIPDHATDLLVTHFSPVFAASFRRVVRPDGVVLIGSPGPMHLYGLKELVYDNPARHEQSEPLASESAFELVDTHSVRYTLTLRDNASVVDLLKMTPFYWSASEATQAHLATLTDLTTAIDVVLHAYRVVE